MKTSELILAAVAATFAAASASGALKPVALAGGNGDDLAGLVAEVCAPNSIRYERFADAVPRVEDFGKYSCIYLGGIPKGTDAPRRRRRRPIATALPKTCSSTAIRRSRARSIPRTTARRDKTKETM